MQENVENQEVLLVKENDSTELKVVTGQDKEGNLRTVAPTEENNPQFMKFDKQKGFLDNFLKNYGDQMKERTHFAMPLIFKVPLNAVVSTAILLAELIKTPEEPTAKKLLDECRIDDKIVDLQKDLKKKEVPTVDESKINWEKYNDVGITRELLEKAGILENMLNWKRAAIPISIYPKIDGQVIPQEVVLNFRERPNGEIGINMVTVRSPRNDQNIDNYTLSALIL